MSAPERVLDHLTGSETFLFSDVERWVRVRRGARQEGGTHEVRHHTLLDEAIAAHGGTRLAVHSELDGTIAAFDHAVEAVEAAVAAQLALQAAARQDGAPMRVRMALHTGEGTSGSDGRYRIGQTLDRGAAICAVGHGGQLLLSAATAARCSDHLPREVTMRDAGWHRLRDLGKPEHVFELEHPNLLSSFPPLQTLDTYRHNLPVQLTPLVGRWREIVAVCGALASDRLLTLTGAAGVGKTRLALAVAAGVLDDFPGGVWWVDLAPLADPDAVIRSALSALGAAPAPRCLLVPPARGRVGRRAGARRARQLRAPGRGLCGVGRRAHDRGADRIGAHHQSRAAGRLRRGHLAGALDAVSWRRGPHRPCGAVSVRSHRPVRGPRASSSTGLRGHGRQCSGHRQDLPAARRNPPGHRAGRRPVPAAVSRAHSGRVGRPLPPPDRRCPNAGGPAPDPAGLARLEPRST